LFSSNLRAWPSLCRRHRMVRNSTKWSAIVTPDPSPSRDAYGCGGFPTHTGGSWRDESKTCAHRGKFCTSGGGQASRRQRAEVAKRRPGIATALSAQDL
jgi:hypothetical protein